MARKVRYQRDKTLTRKLSRRSALEGVSLVWWVIGFALIVLLCSSEVDVLSIMDGVVEETATYAGYLEYYNETISGNEDAFEKLEDQKEMAQYGTVAYVLFGFLWVAQIVTNTGWCAMSGGVCHWYFARKDESQRTHIPLLRSLGRVLTFAATGASSPGAARDRP